MTTAPPIAVPPRRVPVWMWIVLVASLALNLAIIGAIAGFSLSFRYAAIADAPGGSLNLARFAEQLPPERRAEVRRLVAAERGRLMPLRRAAQMARRDAARVLLAEPFDKEAFKVAQQSVVEAETRVRRETADLMASVAAIMTPAERRQVLSFRVMQQLRGKGAVPPDETDPPPAPPDKKDGRPPR